MVPLSTLGGAPRLPFLLLLLLVFAAWMGPRVKAQQDPFRRQFQRVPDHALRATAGAPRAHVRGVSTGECALLCLSERGFHCASFDWSSGGGGGGGAGGGAGGGGGGGCALHGEGLSGEHGLEVAEGTDHYSRVEEGPLSQFLPYGFGAIPGRNHAVFANVSSAECALRCLDEARFRCNSFDFVVGARLCQLSNSFAALVGGIRTDLGTNVMHFERLTSLERSFLGTAGALLGHGWVRTVRQIGPSRCAMLCLRETAFICRSFDYSLATLECHLSGLMESDVGGLVTNLSTPINHFEMRQTTDCGGSFEGTMGTLASVLWPRNYSGSRTCDFKVTVPEGKMVSLNFTHFQLHTRGGAGAACGPGAGGAWVSVRGGADPAGGGPLLATWCGSRPGGSLLTSPSNEVALRFASDGTGSAAGFRAFYSSEWPCNATLREPGVFATPWYPAMHPANHQCTWTLQAPPGFRVHLEFTFFDMEAALFQECTFDYVAVFDGDAAGGGPTPAAGAPPPAASAAPPAAPPLRRLCGNPEVLEPLESAGSRMTAKFKSDSSIQGHGARVRFWFVTEAQVGCSSVLSSEQVFGSPGFPAPYPAGAVCEWIVRAPANRAVEIRFLRFELRSPGVTGSGATDGTQACDSSHDHLVVQDGPSTTSPVVGRYCGSSAPELVVSGASAVRISLWAAAASAGAGGAVGMGGGFSASVRFVTPVAYGPGSRTYAVRLGPSSPRVFASPNWPDLYPRDEDARWELTAPLGHRILLQWLDFQLEGASPLSCRFDSVTVEWGGAPIVLCSDSVPPPVSSRARSLNVSFHSDAGLHFRGFRATITFLPVADEEETTTTRRTTTTAAMGPPQPSRTASTTSPPTPPPPPPVRRLFSGSLTFDNVEFTPALGDRESNVFRAMAEHVAHLLEQALGDEEVRVVVTEFARGSVVARYELAVTSARLVSADELQGRVARHIGQHGGRLGDLAVAPGSLHVADGPSSSASSSSSSSVSGPGTSSRLTVGLSLGLLLLLGVVVAVAAVVLMRKRQEGALLKLPFMYFRKKPLKEDITGLDDKQGETPAYSNPVVGMDNNTYSIPVQGFSET